MLASRQRHSSYFTAQCNGMIELLTETVSAEVIKKVAMPQLQHEQTPDAGGLIAPAVKVIVKQLANRIRVEIPAL